MNKILAALALLFAFQAQAQTSISLGSGVCNGGMTVCTVPNDAGDAIVFTFDFGTRDVTLTVTDAANSTTIYNGTMIFGSMTTNTLYLQVTPFIVALTPQATLTGNWRKTRSGSGRGGWGWHYHWDFQTLTIY